MLIFYMPIQILVHFYSQNSFNSIYKQNGHTYRYAKRNILLRIKIDNEKSFHNHASRIVNYLVCNIQ